MENPNRTNRIMIAAVLLLFLAGLTAAAHFNLFSLMRTGLKAPVAVTAAPIALVAKPVNLARSGSVENADTVPIKAGFPGILSDIYVAQGQTVQTGQPLFTINVSAESFTAGENPANQTKGTSPQLQTNYENALKDFNRYQKLYEIGGIPRKQLDNAAARLQEAQKNLANNQIIEGSPAAHISGPMTVNAPTDGIVTGVKVVAGSALQAEQEIMSIGSGQEIEVVIPLEQQDLYLVHLGSPVIIKLDSESILGQVSAIYPEAKENQVSIFRAHIKIANNPRGLLTLGMQAAVLVDTGQSVQVSAVPSEAVFQNSQKQNCVYIFMNGKALLQQVTLGETIGEFTEITSFLPPEGMIVTNHLHDIKNGDPITIEQ